MEGFLVQFMVMRLPPLRFGHTGCLGGNSMGLILEARSVHSHTFFGSEGRRSLATVRVTGYCVLGRTSQIPSAIQRFI